MAQFEFEGFQGQADVQDERDQRADQRREAAHEQHADRHREFPLQQGREKQGDDQHRREQHARRTENDRELDQFCAAI